MIAIIGALKEEIAPFKELIQNPTVKWINDVEFTSGTYNDKEVVLMLSGVGKVFASMNTTVLCERYNPDFVLNIGTAGGLDPKLEVGDVVISSAVAYNDVDITAFGHPFGQMSKCPLYFKPSPVLYNTVCTLMEDADITIHTGLIVSGDSFLEYENSKKILEHFPDSLAGEMESAAVAHVCHVYNKPFLIARSISDIIGKENHLEFSEYLELASKNSTLILTALINAL